MLKNFKYFNIGFWVFKKKAGYGQLNLAQGSNGLVQKSSESFVSSEESAAGESAVVVTGAGVEAEEFKGSFTGYPGGKDDNEGKDEGEEGKV